MGWKGVVVVVIYWRYGQMLTPLFGKGYTFVSLAKVKQL